MTFKKLATAFLKYGLSALLIGLILWKLASEDAFPKLRDHLFSAEHPKQWTILGVGWLTAFAAISCNIFRWRMLSRTLGLELTLRDALRVGYVSNFVSQLGFGLGLVGGDAVRAVHLAHTNPQHKPEAAATVVVDRAIGLLSLIIMAAVATFFLPLGTGDDQQALRATFWVVRVVGLVAAVGSAIAVIPGLTEWKLWDAVVHVPKIGGILQKLVGALRSYRSRLDALLIALAMSVLSQSLAVVSLYCSAEGLSLKHPSLPLHFVVGPIAMIANALPIGAFEGTIIALYRATVTGLQGEEFLVAIAYRVISVLIALIGLVVYFATRAESAALLEESAAESEAE